MYLPNAAHCVSKAPTLERMGKAEQHSSVRRRRLPWVPDNQWAVTTRVSLGNDLTCLCFGGVFFSSNFLSPYFLYVKGTPYLAAGFVIFWAGTREMALCPDAGLLPAWKDKQFFFSSSLQWIFCQKTLGMVLFYFHNHWQQSNVCYPLASINDWSTLQWRSSLLCFSLRSHTREGALWLEPVWVWCSICIITVVGNPN